MSTLLGRLTPWIAGAAALIALPHVFSSGFALTLMSQIGLLIVFALAYNMLLGQGGMLSFGHAVYFGLAGYFTVHYLNFIYEEQVPYIPVTLIPLFRRPRRPVLRNPHRLRLHSAGRDHVRDDFAWVW